MILKRCLLDDASEEEDQKVTAAGEEGVRTKSNENIIYFCCLICRSHYIAR